MISGAKEKNWSALLVPAVLTVTMVANLCNGRKSCYQDEPYGYCNLACRQTCRMVFLEVTNVTQSEKKVYSEDTIMAVVDLVLLVNNCYFFTGVVLIFFISNLCFVCVI